MRIRTLGKNVVAAIVVAALILLFFLPYLVKKAPEVARQVWSYVAVRRVEGHAAELRAAAAESGLDPCLLAAVMYAESSGRIDVVSNKGALGAFQLMPSAAGDAAKRLGLPEPSRADTASARPWLSVYITAASRHGSTPLSAAAARISAAWPSTRRTATRLQRSRASPRAISGARRSSCGKKARSSSPTASAASAPRTHVREAGRRALTSAPAP